MESITKEGISAFKAQSDAMETAARAGYLKSDAALKEFQRSKEFLDHQIRVAESPQRIAGEEHRKLLQFTLDIEKKSAEELRGVPTPAIIKRFFNVDDMGTLATYYGRNNLEKIMDSAMRMQSSMDSKREAALLRKDAVAHNEAVKWIAIAERYGGDILKIGEQPSMETFLKQYPTPAEQQKAMFFGVKPRNVDQEAHLKQLQAQRDAAYRQAYGPAYDEMMKIRVGAGGGGEVRVIKPTGAPPVSPGLGPAVANPPPESTLKMYKDMIFGGGT